jgi:hypothetical protein
MEIKLRYVMSYLACKGMNLLAIVAELATVHHKDAFEENRMKIGYATLSYMVPI